MFHSDLVSRNLQLVFLTTIIPVQEVAEHHNGRYGEPPADGGRGGRVGLAGQPHVEAGADGEGDDLEDAQHEHANSVTPVVFWKIVLQGVPSARGLGWVDLNFKCSNV